MATFQNFRGAFHGFNREDVVRYIELLNNQHAAQCNQLNNEILSLRAQLAEAKSREADPAVLEEALKRNEELERALAEAQAHSEQARTNEELEAYRRAERAERIANDRVNQMFLQASAILASATAATDETATKVGQLTEQVCQQLSQLQAALNGGADVIRETAAAMYAIRPGEKENP